MHTNFKLCKAVWFGIEDYFDRRTLEAKYFRETIIELNSHAFSFIFSSLKATLKSSMFDIILEIALSPLSRYRLCRNVNLFAIFKIFYSLLIHMFFCYGCYFCDFKNN